jgi:hypothetical protein
MLPCCHLLACMMDLSVQPVQHIVDQAQWARCARGILVLSAHGAHTLAALQHWPGDWHAWLGAHVIDDVVMD